MFTGYLVLFCFAISLSVIAIFLLARQHPITKVRRWQKSLNLSAHLAVFDAQYQSINGALISRKARKNNDAIEFIYGEIEFLPFIALLSLVKPNANTVFYDLGCGVGKAVLACAMVYPVAKSAGIELLPELYSTACQQKDQLASIGNYSYCIDSIVFYNADFLLANYDDATLIFINSTTFIGEAWVKLCARIDNLPKILTVITISKPLACTNFTLLKSTKLQMSWGVVEAYIHNKKTNFN